MIQSYNPADVWSPFGAFSMAVVQDDGRIVHLKGQVALDRNGQIVGKGDMRAQVRQALANIRAVLRSFGGDTADIIALTHHTTDIDAFMKTGDIRREFFAPPYPVTTTVEVTRLYDTELMIEITATAEIPRERFRTP